MSMTISAYELSLVAWSHQASYCERVLPLSASDNAHRYLANRVRAYGITTLYGVTPTGDELDLMVHWRARGERSPDFGHACVFSEPSADLAISNLVSFRQSVALIDNDQLPLLPQARTHAILDSIRCCDWQFPARQCLPRRHVPAPTSPLGAHHAPGCSAVSA